MVMPLNSVSSHRTRRVMGTEGSKRKHSSTADPARAGLAASFSNSPGYLEKHTIPLEMSPMVVSSPATSRPMLCCNNSSVLRLSPDSSAATSWPRISPDGLLRSEGAWLFYIFIKLGLDMDDRYNPVNVAPFDSTGAE